MPVKTFSPHYLSKQLINLCIFSVKMTKKASEVESQVKVVLSKVEKLRTAHEERQKVSENNTG